MKKNLSRGIFGKMIKVKNVSHHYGIRPILKDVSLEVGAGELTCVMGPNGMGKTTLLGIVAGILNQVKGTVEIDGLQRGCTPEEDLEIRRKTAFLPDHPWLPRMRTGREFLLAVGRVYEVGKNRLKDHVERLLRLFNLEKKANSAILSYSNGQKKKLALASVMATDSPVLILDEPFSGGLDPSGILALKKVLKWMTETEKKTVIMATPVPEIVEDLAHRIAILRHGEIAAFDTPEGLRKLTGCEGSLKEVLEHPIHPQTFQNIEQYFAGESV